MKVIADRVSLQGALRQCRKTIRRMAGSVPIHSAVRLTTDNEAMRVEAFDLSRHILVGCACETPEPGSCCVSCEHLLRLLDGSHAERLTLSVKEKVATMTTGDMRGTLYGFDHKEFPDLEQEENFIGGFTIPAAELLEILTRIAPAQSMRVVDLYSGIHFGSDENHHLVVEATDKRRIHIQQVDIEVRGQLDAIVPVEVTGLLKFLLETAADSAEAILNFTPAKVFLHLGNTILRASLIEGTFPNLHSAMPPVRKKCIVPTQVFMNAIDTVARFMAGIDSETIAISARNGSVTISCEVPGIGKCETRLDYEQCEDPIRFNISYIFLRDAISAIRSDRLTLDYEDWYLPICIREEGFQAAIASIRSEDARPSQPATNERIAEERTPA